MVEPNCPKCKKEKFSVKAVNVGPKYISLIYCSDCGSVVGVVDSI